MQDGHSQEVTLQTAKLAWKLVEGSFHDLLYLSDTPQKRTLTEAFKKAEVAYNSMRDTSKFTYSHLASRTLNAAYKNGMDRDFVHFIHKAVLYKNRPLPSTELM